MILCCLIIYICSQSLLFFLKEWIPDNLQKIADLPHQFQNARTLSVLQAVDMIKVSKKPRTIKRR